MPLSPFAEASKKISQFIAQYWLLPDESPAKKEIKKILDSDDPESIKKLLKEQVGVDLDELFSPISVTVKLVKIEDKDDNFYKSNKATYGNIKVTPKEVKVIINFPVDKPTDIEDKDILLWANNYTNTADYLGYDYGLRASSSC